MRYFLALVTACLVSALQPLCAQSATDPGDLFVNAYMAVQQAEKAEQSGNYRTAMTKLRFAAEILDGISRNYPTWQPPIVTYRKQRTSDGIARVQEKLGKFGPGKNSDGNGDGRNTGTLIPDEEIFAPMTDVGPEPGAESVAPVRSGSRKTTAKAVEEDPTTGLQTSIDRMKKLGADLREANAAAERAEREKKDLVRKYEEALQAREASEKQQKMLQTRADAAEERLLKAQTEIKVDAEKIKALQTEAAEAKRVVKNAKIEQDAEAEFHRQLSDRLKAAQAKIAKVTSERDALELAGREAPKKIQQLEQQLEKANTEKKDLNGKLAETKAQLVTMTGQRDDAMKQLSQLKEASKNVDKLMSENASLMAKLADTEKAVANFKADGEEKDKQIAALKREVGSVKEQLAMARTESANYQRQMGDLQAKLEDQGRQLSQVKADNASGTAERKKMQVENDILRGIVLRQQKQEAVRAATKKLVLGELAKLDINSATLLKEIDFLSQPVVKLTPKEMDLFKKPSLQVSNDEISANLPKSGEPDALPAADPVAVVGKPAPEAVPGAEPTSTIEIPGSAPAMEIASAKPTLPSALPGDTTPLPALPGETTAPVQGEAPAATETLGSVAGQPNIPAEYLPLARDGKELFEKGDYRGAEKIYEKILAKVPNNLYILSNLGVVRFRAGKLKQAEEVLVKATKVAPEDGFSHCTYGIVLYTGGKLDEAVSALTKALAINPKNATAHNYLGITAAGKGWQEAAQKELETATTLDPSYADAHFNLAVVFATQTPPNKENARKYYKRATELGAEADSSLEQMLK